MIKASKAQDMYFFMTMGIKEWEDNRIFWDINSDMEEKSWWDHSKSFEKKVENKFLKK